MHSRDEYLEDMFQVHYLQGYEDACKNYEATRIQVRILIACLGGILLGSSVTYVIVSRLFNV